MTKKTNPELLKEIVPILLKCNLEEFKRIMEKAGIEEKIPDQIYESIDRLFKMDGLFKAAEKDPESLQAVLEFAIGESLYDEEDVQICVSRFSNKVLKGIKRYCEKVEADLHQVFNRTPDSGSRIKKVILEKN